MQTTQVMIGHVDADAFYVAAERVRYPHLLTLPVGVLGNQGACVVAKSYEMKAFGIKTGEPVWEATKKCPDGVYVKRDFRWYEVLSEAMRDVVKEFSPSVEFYSIDESFFLALPARGKTLQETAEAIRDRIKHVVGVPSTVGIARTKTLAKLISDSAKPFGAKAVTERDEEIELLAGLPVTEISGIAGRRERLLRPWGIQTCLDLARADRGLIRELLTSTGEAIWWELSGEPCQPIHTTRPGHKVLSRGGSFGGEKSADPHVLYAWLIRNVERLVEELEYYGTRTGRVGVWVGYGNGRQGQAYASLPSPTDRFDILLDALRPCLRQAWLRHETAIRMHLFASQLVPRSRSQLGLFDGDDARSEVLAHLKRSINLKHGRFALRSAATLPLSTIYDDDSNQYDICDIHGKICF